MTIIKNGMHLEMSNRSTGRVIFSAATDQLDKETFDKLWSAIGDNIFKGNESEQIQYFEVRVSPIR